MPKNIPTIHISVVYSIGPKEERVVKDEEVDVEVIKRKAIEAIDQMRICSKSPVKTVYIAVLPQKPPCLRTN